MVVVVVGVAVVVAVVVVVVVGVGVVVAVVVVVGVVKVTGGAMQQANEKISINGVEYVRADQVPAAPPQKPETPLSVGNAVLLRTVTHYYTGRVGVVTGDSVILTDAAWVADTGRFAEALRTGKLGDVEPFSDPVLVSRGALVDVTLWRHPLPREVK